MALPLLVLLALLAASVAPLGGAARPAELAQEEPAAEVIVVLQPGSDPGAVARAAGVRPRRLYKHVFRGFAGNIPQQALRGLRNNPRVQIISPDRPVAIAQQQLPAGVDRVEADLYPGAVGSGAVVNADVAILDTGIDVNHPDLNVAGGVDCTGIGNYADDNGHGTHVAGTVGAMDNGSGVVGVAPGAALWAVKVLDADGFGSWSSIICGLDWVYANRGTIDVANMSLGGSGSDSTCANDALHLAICQVVSGGTPVIVAAGNESADTTTSVPATYDEVIAVSAFADFDGQPGSAAAATCQTGDRDDRFAAFSNYGADVDIAAPGRCVRSTIVGGGTGLLSGTSMAAPHAAGAAALYKAGNPQANAAQVRQWLLGPASEPQNSAVGFSGDPDPFPERVLNLDLAQSSAPMANPPAAPSAQPPVAKADAYQVAEDKVLRRRAPGVLANDRDPEGGPVRVVRIVKRPTKGTVRLQANGTMVYRPKRNATGRDTFTYEVVDSQGLKAAARVQIRVLPRPD